MERKWPLAVRVRLDDFLDQLSDGSAEKMGPVKQRDGMMRVAGPPDART